MKDLYKILGVSEDASADALKKAYRKLAKENHPDATGGDKRKTERFKEINEAYQILSDDKKRAEYDTYGSTFGSNPSGPQGFGGFDFSGFQGFNGQQGQPFGEGVEFDLGDIFGDFFHS